MMIIMIMITACQIVVVVVVVVVAVGLMRLAGAFADRLTSLREQTLNRKPAAYSFSELDAPSRQSLSNRFMICQHSVHFLIKND